MHACRLFDARSHRGAIRMPTPGINIFLGWNPADTNVLATVSDSNVVTFLDMRKGKHLKTLKNRQEVRQFLVPCLSLRTFICLLGACK